MILLKFIKSMINRFPILEKVVKIAKINQEISETKHLIAKILIDQIKQNNIYENIHDTEFKVYSQWGDDGIIQYLINNIDIPEEFQIFVEFGVGNYTESNTRFLLINNNWKGLVMDSNSRHINFIKNDEIYWKFDLTAISCFVNKDNINELLSKNNFIGEIGLLHIDIDGNDYWIWESINVINPIIVIVEYNSIFGNKHAITVPYDSNFDRTKAHYSNLYFGTSLKALSLLADKKGYFFVGSNKNGNNAYFVRKDMIGNIKIKRIEESYIKSKFRESVDEKGNLTYISGEKRVKLIKDMDIYDIEEKRLIKIKDLFK